MKPFNHRAVMAGRREAPDSLEMFPTPPWATRALCELLIDQGFDLDGRQAWDPCCGEGHMAGPLSEYFARVEASDVFDYGRGYRAKDFLDGDSVYRPEWIVANPPFSVATQFAERAYGYATRGAALLVRSVWLEGTRRHGELFGPNPPSIIAQFCERVPMTKGRWDPAATTATAYCWVVWLKRGPRRRTEFTWLAPGTKARCTRPDDAARYGAVADAPLLSVGAEG